MPAKKTQIDWAEKAVKEGLDAIGELEIEEWRRPSIWEAMFKAGWIIPKKKNTDTIKTVRYAKVQKETSHR